MILAGDIGGTKTHLAIFTEKEKRKWVIDKKFKSHNYESLCDIVKEFLSDNLQYQIKSACFGIAGPIQNRKCKATNLPWVIEAAALEKQTGIPQVHLMNDLEANAYGISCLEKEEFFSLNPGKEHKGNASLISAGTGLGEAGIFWDGKKHIPFACEGGHCSFAPENSIEMQLWQFLYKQYGHVSFERVLSGPGLYNIYRFLIEEGIEKHEEAVEKAMEKTDPPHVITEMGKKKTSLACMRALELFVSIYGSEAGNLALKMFATGGVYLGGGLAPKILKELSKGNFMKRFTQKGRFATLLINIPVQVVLNEDTALLGAAYYARKYGRT